MPSDGNPSPCVNYCEAAYDALTTAALPLNDLPLQTLCQQPFCIGLNDPRYETLCNNPCVTDGLDDPECERFHPDWSFYCRLHAGDFVCANHNL